jgi:LmbE family N-acetylglucosaminyl deacetylase
MGNKKPVLLAVLAHPDDESFGMGGTLALYAARGVDVNLICATRGEAGEMSTGYMEGYSSIGERREAELRCAAGILGIKEIYFLGYRDSGMQGSPDNKHPRALAIQPVDEVAAKIAHQIRKFKPDVVLTFDPIGGYRHPDHIAIHKATVRAFEKSDDPSFGADVLEGYQAKKLYYHVISRNFIKFFIKILPLFGKDPHRWGSNADIDITLLAGEEFPINAIIDIRSVIRKKNQAGACHASQGGGQVSMGIMSWIMRITGKKETYMRAFPPVQACEKVEKDLITGI